MTFLLYPFRVLVTSSGTTTLTNAIRVDSSAAAANQRPNGRALLAAGNPAYRRAADCAASGRYFIPVFLPETAPMFVAITDASAMRMCGVAMPVPEVPALRLRRHRHHQSKHHRRHQNC